MKNSDLLKEKFIKKYIEYTLNMRLAMQKNNYKKNNYIAKKFNKLVFENKDQNFFEEALYILMNDEHTNVKVAAASDSLRNKVHIEYALKLLKEEAQKNDKFDSIAAEMVLKMYNGEIPNRTL